MGEDLSAAAAVVLGEETVDGILAKEMVTAFRQQVLAGRVAVHDPARGVRGQRGTVQSVEVSDVGPPRTRVVAVAQGCHAADHARERSVQQHAAREGADGRLYSHGRLGDDERWSWVSEPDLA